MEILIYNLLDYIKTYNKIPLSRELSINDELLTKLVIKCNSEDLLAKSLVFVNILGKIEYDENPKFAIICYRIQFTTDNQLLRL